MKPNRNNPNELHFHSAKSILKDALPPQPPPVYWKHNDKDLAITAGSINIISSDSTSKAVQLSLRIAMDVALTKEPITPTRGLNPYTNINESEDYDKMLASEASVMPVLYINTIMTEAQLEREMIAALPQLPEWIWVHRDRGASFPYGSLELRTVSASMGTLMKDEHKKTLMDFIRHNKIKFVVLNSFEFACRTQREKDDMMCLIKELRDTRGCAVLVFTRENETRLKTATRGALPMLAMISDFVVALDALAPEIEARKIEYSEPIAADQPRIPIYHDKEDVIATLRETTEDTLISVAPLLSTASSVPKPNFDIVRNGNPPMNIL